MVRYYEYIPRMELHNREAGSTKLFSYDYARMTIRGDTDTGISTYHLTMLRNAWVDQYLHQIGDILYESSVPIPGQDPIACIITDVVATNGGQVYEIDAVSVASVLQRTQSQLQLTNTTSAAIVQALAAEAGYHYYHYGGTSRSYAEWDSRGIPVWDAVRRFCAGENCYASIYNNDYNDPTMSYSPPRHTLVVRPVPSTPSATLTTGQEIISEPEWIKDDKNIVNDLVLQCNGFTRSYADSSSYRDTASAAKYGLCSRRISRMDIDDVADADAFAAGFIAKLATPKTVCKATVTSHTHSYTELGNEYVIVRPHAIGELYTIVDEINGRTQDLLLRSYNYDSSKDAYEAVFSEPNLDSQSYFNDQASRITDLEGSIDQSLRTTDYPTFAGATVGGVAIAAGAVDGVDLSAKAPVWDAKQNALSGDVSGHYHSTDRNLANSTGTLALVRFPTGTGVLKATGSTPSYAALTATDIASGTFDTTRLNLANLAQNITFAGAQTVDGVDLSVKAPIWDGKAAGSHTHPYFCARLWATVNQVIPSAREIALGGSEVRMGTKSGNRFKATKSGWYLVSYGAYIDHVATFIATMINHSSGARYGYCRTPPVANWISNTATVMTWMAIGEEVWLFIEADAYSPNPTIFGGAHTTWMNVALISEVY